MLQQSMVNFYCELRLGDVFLRITEALSMAIIVTAENILIIQILIWVADNSRSLAQKLFLLVSNVAF